jgi:predicted HicB family RNase H-like nuclease
MDLTPYVVTVEDSLLAAAEAGDEGTRRAATALAAALEPAVRLALLNALAELAADVTDALGDRVVEVRLDGGEARVVASPAPRDDRPEPSAVADADDGEPTRITLRLPEGLKARAEQAAAAESLSLNTWLTRAVRDALATPREGGRPRVRDRGARVRGWVQG